MSSKKSFLVSLLKSMYDKQPEAISMDAIYQLLILEALRSDTEKHRYHRSIGQKKEAQAIKNKMMNFTPSVILSGGKAEEHIVDYTSLGFADFDHVSSDDLERCLNLLNADPYVVLAYITISGEGIRVVYLTDVTDIRYHSDVFLQGNAYYADLLGYPYDAHCSNSSRTSILCYCPQAVYHPQAEVMHIELTPQRDETDKMPVKRCGRPTKRAEATASDAEPVVLQLLEEGGKTYAEGHYNEYVSAALYLMNHYGVPENEALEWAVERFPDYESTKLRSITHSIYLHTDEHGIWKLSSAGGEKKSHSATPFEVEQFISTQAKVRNNVVTDRREICLEGERSFRDITDRDENTLWVRACKAGINTSPRTVQMVLNSEYVDNYDPFSTYLFDLDPWDGVTDFIRQLTDTIRTSNQEVFHRYFTKWFVGLIASLLDPTVVNHEVLVLIGKQGLYKTTWMNRLLPPEWDNYFFTKTNSTTITKDDKISLSEFALICLEEIDYMRISDVNQFKAIVSLPAVNERSPYAHNKSRRPHVASFCATGNNLNYLNDPTGTRRWLSFEALSIKSPYETNLPYREIYAQGLALYRSGFQYWFQDKEIDELIQHNQRFQQPCLEEELIQMYYRKPLPGEHGVFASTAEIIQRISGQIKFPLHINSMGTILRKMGFQSCRSNNIRGYRVMEFTQQEITARKQMIDLPEEKSLDF